MKNDKSICPKCSGKLQYYTQPAFTFRHDINKDGSIRKIPENRKSFYIKEDPDTCPEYVQCNDCRSEFEFELDDNNRIVLIAESE